MATSKSGVSFNVFVFRVKRSKNIRATSLSYCFYGQSENAKLLADDIFE